MNEERHIETTKEAGQVGWAMTNALASLITAIKMQPGIDGQRLIHDFFIGIPAEDHACEAERLIYRQLGKRLRHPYR